MDPVIARKTWRTLEPYHGLVYFAPEVATRYAELGLKGRDGYFASRSAAMGAVKAEVVMATFFNFNPDLVRAAIPHAWDLAPPSAILAARLEGIGAALEAAVGPELLADESITSAAALARQAAEAARFDGRPLGASHAALPWPEEPHLVLWHAITVLREHRGDGHVACLVETAIDGCEALVLHAASGDVSREALQTTRGWSDEAWAAAVDRLAGRGLVGGSGAFTDAGRAFRQGVEDRTDALGLGPWTAIGEEGCADLRAAVRPLSRAIVEAGSFGLQ